MEWLITQSRSFRKEINVSVCVGDGGGKKDRTGGEMGEGRAINLIAHGTGTQDTQVLFLAMLVTLGTLLHLVCPICKMGITILTSPL